LKKTIISLGLGSMLALAACSNNHDQGEGRRMSNSPNDNRNTVHPDQVSSPVKYYDEDQRQKKSSSHDFGFVRMNTAEINGKNTAHQTPSIDREQLAHMISRLCAQMPDVSNVATLVTDEEALVVYRTHSKNRFETADQVKKTASSVVPRYFHIYVSDNHALANDIESYANLHTTSKNIDYAIDKTIQQMLKSPQGRKLSDGEDANGRMLNESNSLLNKNSEKSSSPSNQSMK
jgi:hypothetical protein